MNDHESDFVFTGNGSLYVSWKLKHTSYHLILQKKSQDAFMNIMNRELSYSGKHAAKFKLCNANEGVELQLSVVARSLQCEQVFW